MKLHYRVRSMESPAVTAVMQLSPQPASLRSTARGRGYSAGRHKAVIDGIQQPHLFLGAGQGGAFRKNPFGFPVVDLVAPFSGNFA